MFFTETNEQSVLVLMREAALDTSNFLPRFFVLLTDNDLKWQFKLIKIFISGTCYLVKEVSDGLDLQPHFFCQ